MMMYVARWGWVVSGWLALGVSLLGCGADASPSDAALAVALEALRSDTEESQERTASGALRASSARACAPLALRPLGSYRSGVFDEAAAEIVAHDPATSRLFVVNAAEARVDVLDASDPSAPGLVSQLDLSGYGGSVTSVAVHDGVLAAALPAEVRTEPGRAVFVDTRTLDVIASVEVGALPDMLTFSADGRYVLTANEGEPSDDYLTDPEGSVSIIDLSRGVARLTQRRVRTAGFGEIDPAGLDPSIRVFGPGATLAQDLEPEFLTVSADSRTAWVTLQENNALAEVDVRSAKVVRLSGLGTKDHGKRGQGLDPSDKDDAIAIGRWPVRGLYLPDAIASYRALGRTFLVMANEGDTRDYEGFSEEERVADLTLDPRAFPDASALQEDAALGRLKVTSTLGDEDGDGDYDALYALGARSFSIRSTSGALVFDSGSQLERLSALIHPDHFNADNTDGDFDGRSDDKGPEPEGLTLGALDGRTYAFIGLERIGSVVAYDISNPYAPCLVGYVNGRDFAGDPEIDQAGDLAPEGLLFVAPDQSPSGQPLLVVANEVSGSTTIYALGAAR